MPRNYNRRLGWLMFFAILIPVTVIVLMGALTTFLLPHPALIFGYDARLATWAAALTAAVLAAIGVTFALSRMRSVFRRRAIDLAEAFEQVTNGNRAARAESGGNDEFAVLALAANRLIGSAPAPSAQGGGGGDATHLQAQIERLMQDVSRLSEGDLRIKAEVTPDALGVLADAFNFMAEELGKVVGHVQSTALQVTNATRRLLTRSAEVSQASQQGAMQARQVFDLVAQLAEFVQLSAQNSLTTVDSAQEALRSAQGGQETLSQTIGAIGNIRENVQETSKKIKRLGERAQEVGEIVRIIEEIAEQTNLLALNAAIKNSSVQAEGGLGFTGADEIQALAERAAAASKRVGTIVRTIQSDTQDAVVAMEQSTQDVVQGSRLAEDTGRALQTIFVAIERQAKLAETVANAAGERTRNAETIARTTRQITDIARLTNDAVQETADGITYLADLAEQLRASVAAFRLPEQVSAQEGLMPQSGQSWQQGQSGAAWQSGQSGFPMPPDAAAHEVTAPFTGYNLPGDPSRWDEMTAPPISQYGGEAGANGVQW